MKRLTQWLRSKVVGPEGLTELEAQNAVRTPRSLTGVTGVYPLDATPSLDHD